MPSVTIQVTYEPRSTDEVVCVTGNIPSLGSWHPDGLQPMTRDGPSPRWSLMFEAAEGSAIRYRYAVCSFLQTQGSKVTVHRWETNIAPRQVTVTDKSATEEMQTFGEYGGKSSIQRGWLVDQREIRLIFNKANLGEFASSTSCNQWRVKVIATDITDSTLQIPVLVHNLTFEDHLPRQQSDSGESISDGSDIMVFATQGLPAAHDVRFVVHLIHSSSTTESNDTRMLKKWKGSHLESSIISSSLADSVGQILLCFFDEDGEPVGKVTVSYTVIEPLTAPEAHSFEVSYATHWTRKKKALNIGHRGMGKSFKDHSLKIDIGEDEKLVSVQENTVFSLSEAAEHGADFVEFDVHVTKDGCPVLFHDFQFSLCMQENGEESKVHLAKLAIKDMTLEQISAIKQLTPVGMGTTEFLCQKRTAGRDDELSFSTLKMALETVPTACGFDIEVKYPMICEDSGPEYDGSPMDMNASLDAILSVVLQHGGDRRIFFSAFNPDVCSMIRLKQSKYPVMLCNYGRTELYESYADPRSNTVPNSILTCLSNQILGMCGHCEDYIADPTLVEKCHGHGLVLACWGERTIDPEIRNKLAEVGVDAIIHDRMGSFARGTKNNFVSR